MLSVGANRTAERAALAVAVLPFSGLLLSAVLFFGEIIPSAVFTAGPNRLKIAANLSNLVWCIMTILAPVVMPIAWTLDRLIPEESSIISKAEVRALVAVHREIAREEGAKPLTIVTEFVDLLTRRLLSRQVRARAPLPAVPRPPTPRPPPAHSPAFSPPVCPLAPPLTLAPLPSTFQYLTFVWLHTPTTPVGPRAPWDINDR